MVVEAQYRYRLFNRHMLSLEYTNLKYIIKASSLFLSHSHSCSLSLPPSLSLSLLSSFHSTIYYHHLSHTHNTTLPNTSELRCSRTLQANQPTNQAGIKIEILRFNSWSPGSRSTRKGARGVRQPAGRCVCCERQQNKMMCGFGQQATANCGGV